MKLQQAYLSVIAALAFCEFGNAHSLAPRTSYTTLSPGGEFVFVMIGPIPVDREVAYWEECNEKKAQEIRRIRATYSASGLYRNDGSQTPLWTVDWYAYNVYPASDGVHLIRPGLGALWSERWDATAVEFYAHGTLLRSYKVGELVDLPWLLLNDNIVMKKAHFQSSKARALVDLRWLLRDDSFVPGWRSESAFDNDTMRYTLLTKHGDRFVFDVQTGKIVEGSRAVAWARSGGFAATLLTALVLLWRWRRKRRSTADKVARTPEVIST